MERRKLSFGRKRFQTLVFFPMEIFYLNSQELVHIFDNGIIKRKV